ncbi:MAG: hemolysin III family protein [Deferrisomatales bacterium]|nr:hemolysin III family protein [Deferrisomatales bacterium]
MAHPLRGKRHNLPEYTAGEEVAHVITHGLGAALSLIALVLLVGVTWVRGDAWHLASTAIYGATLLILYSGSTLYHSARSPRWRHVTKVIDHCAIYLLIAGTYTPFTLVTLRGPWGWTLFGTVWALALIGVVAEAWWVYRPEKLATALYLVLGWVVVIAIKPLYAALPAGGLVWLVAGGLSYSLGTIFYVMKKTRYMHAVWHLFVLGGSICHFVAVALYVVPG